MQEQIEKAGRTNIEQVPKSFTGTNSNLPEHLTEISLTKDERRQNLILIFDIRRIKPEFPRNQNMLLL